jgi:hypothetical protein
VSVPLFKESGGYYVSIHHFSFKSLKMCAEITDHYRFNSEFAEKCLPLKFSEQHFCMHFHVTLVPDFKRRSQTEFTREQGAEENIWTDDE